MKAAVYLALLCSLLASPGVARAAGGAPAAPCDPGFFRAELERQLASHFNLEGDFQLDYLRPWTPPAGAASRWEVSVTEYPAVAASIMTLRFQLLGDGAPFENGSLLVRGCLWRDVWFAREPVQAGETFSPGLLAVQRVDCFRAHDGLPANAGDRSMIFSRDVAADRMLTWHDLSKRPLVRKGALVEVTAREGELYVTMKALALQNGASGDIITLRNIESHNEISGQVVDDNRVEVHF
jgi:flagella basal body P-ring formation protein FlgA